MQSLGLVCLLFLTVVPVNASDDYLSLVDGKTFEFRAYAISTDEAAKQLAAAVPPVLLDAREKDEFAASHLSGARLISYRHFDPTQVADIPKDRAILLYCTIGYRSGKVAQRLSKAGYHNVHNIRGGIIQWFNEGRLVVRDGKPVNEIHPYNDVWKKFIVQRPPL